MNNLIVTPVYKAYDVVKRMCDAIDQFTVYPYLHVLIDDDSGLEEKFPVSSTRNRKVLMIKRDVEGMKHVNGCGQALQLGYDFALQTFDNQKPNPRYDYVFVIESDVVVKEGWDKKQIDLIPTLPPDWGSLDVQSVDEEGKVTYPCTVSPRIGYVRSDLEQLTYLDFQQTLISPRALETGVKFGDYPSHYDILYSRKLQEKADFKFYRTTLLSTLHVNGGGNSRDLLPK